MERPNLDESAFERAWSDATLWSLGTVWGVLLSLAFAGIGTALVGDVFGALVGFVIGFVLALVVALALAGLRQRDDLREYVREQDFVASIDALMQEGDRLVNELAADLESDDIAAIDAEREAKAIDFEKRADALIRERAMWLIVDFANAANAHAQAEQAHLRKVKAMPLPEERALYRRFRPNVIRVESVQHGLAEVRKELS